MGYTWAFSKLFASEFKRLPIADQGKILDFIDVYEIHGLVDFSKYEGKITPSWTRKNLSNLKHLYAYENALWHYHIGIPDYLQSHSKYKTSDWLLHFQWFDKGENITLVDLYSHYTFTGDFYLPPESYLK